MNAQQIIKDLRESCPPGCQCTKKQAADLIEAQQRQIEEANYRTRQWAESANRMREECADFVESPIGVKLASLNDGQKQLAAAIRDGWYGQQPMAAPTQEGWKLVPAEPTPAMIDAAMRLPNYFDLGDEWRAMFAAAPQPPTADAIAQAVAAEREACLSVAGSAKEGAVMSKYATTKECWSARNMAERIENAIRARSGQTTAPAIDAARQEGGA